jgi:DNA-binding transcriptional MerR regulator
MTEADRRLYRLADLAAATGFSVRQIRYYIVQRLVPGAGDERGPQTMYGEETLDRLKLIARYKSMPVPPADRTLTLEEIRRLLDAMTPQEIHERASDESDDDHARHLEAAPAFRLACRLALPEQMSVCFDMNEKRLWEPPAPDARGILAEAARSMEELSSRRPRPGRARDDSWQRLRSPLLEVHVKVPTDERERGQLRRLAESLNGILKGM